MRTSVLTLAVLAGLGVLAGCTGSADTTARSGEVSVPARQQAAKTSTPTKGMSTVASASLSDHVFAAVDDTMQPVQRGASTLQPLRISEANAIAAIADGEMTMPTPSGVPVRLKYERHVEHEDGNWTWVGSVDGQPGAKAVLTFGPKAVFGSIRPAGSAAFNVTTMGGRAYMVNNDRSKLVDAPIDGDDVASLDTAPVAAAVDQAMKRKAASGSVSLRTSSAQAATATSTVDIVLGYTDGLVTFLGGESQALTRLQHLVDLTNQAYVDSRVDGSVRLVRAVRVAYSDTTTNEQALFALTGVSCTTVNPGQVRLPSRGVNCLAATRPAALEPLFAARDQTGADLVSLVRPFQNPEQGSCGVGWIPGGGQTVLDGNDAQWGFSVVSDSNGIADNAVVCREETLAHELGHNMGLQHDAATAAGSDDTNTDGNVLDPEEYGAFPYAFGYNSVAGNFYTIMANRSGDQDGFLVFANPSITTCNGMACGNSVNADNARALNQTMSIVANFRVARAPMGGNWVRGDFNGDKKSDIIWRNNVSGTNTIWLTANVSTRLTMASMFDMAWDIQGVGDFDGDGKSDVLWRNTITGSNTIWRSGNSSTRIAVSGLAAGWQVVGVADFNGDKKADILWRNSIDGRNAIWRSGSATTQTYVSAVTDQNFQVAGVGDFNGDGKADILWRNFAGGTSVIWRSGSSLTTQAVTFRTPEWIVAAVADFTGDRKADILWRNSANGSNVIWRGADSAQVQGVTGVAAVWFVAGTGDFNADNKQDIIWRNATSGTNVIWLSANAATQQKVSYIAPGQWTIGG
ncbi:MAG: hypothetical protein HOQ01_13570 [Lysobacter sp.]|nr:hypothetical protein [Lysobacter sp.]